VPCITLRSNTERPATVEEGTNVLVGPDPDRVGSAWRRVLDSPRNGARVPELWDGKAAGRILDVLAVA
jgi:UDP-N-acetylglucosamine 2-epimerase (non-hydrolysing)